jgi:hypothetical protein
VVFRPGLAGLPGAAVDGQGDVFIADPANSRVLEVRADGSQTTVGSGLLRRFTIQVTAKDGNGVLDRAVV